MASRIIETIERDGKTIWVYDNGMEKDASNGHIVKPPPATLIMDTVKSTELHRARQERKRQAVLRGAARTLERGDWEKATDLDVVEAIAEAVTIKALNPDNAKQVDAARFILQESGLAASQERDGAEIPAGAPSKLYLLIAQLREMESDVVDGQVLRSDILISDDTSHSSVDTGSPTGPKDGQDGDA